jgi:biopolymer transport protein ExbB
MDMTVVIMNAWQVLFKGGPMMWPILLLSIIAMAIGFNRLMVLFALEKKLSAHKQVLFESLRQGRLKETLRICDQNPGILSSLLKAGILKFDASRDIIKGDMEEVLDYEVSRVKEYTDILSLIVNLAPLIGLLGTINAMAVVFHAVQIRSNVLNPLTAGELASGIWQAILTTAAGLTVAILAFAMYSFCAARINAVIAYLQRAVLEMINILQQLSELKRVAAQEQGDES